MFKALLRNRVKRSLRFKNLHHMFIASFITLACTISLTPCYAQQIITDGNTATSLNTVGTVTDVTTTTTRGTNAFNSFSKFNVDAGNTVNLVVPNASDNLINLVTGQQTQINGILNSVKNGNVGGNIFLANPNGIVIGTQGVVNVGSITAVTPTADFTNNFFNGAGDPDDASVSALIDGSAPINVGGEINNSGKINAITDVKLSAGSITNAGEIYTDAVYGVEAGDVVNLNSLDYVADPDDLVLNNGDIKLTGQEEITNTGKLFAGNNVNINAGGKVNVEGTIYGDLTINADDINIDATSNGTDINGNTTLIGDNISIFGRINTNNFNATANLIRISNDYLIALGDINIDALGLILGPACLVSEHNININALSTDNLQCSFSAANDINISINNWYIGPTSELSAGNNINIETQNQIIVQDSLFNAGSNINFIANDYIVEPFSTITAGNNVVFSRATAGDIEISATGMLTPQELDRVDGNIVIGNHADTNSLTERITINSNLYTDGDSIEFNGTHPINVNSIISTRNLNDVWSDNHLTALSQGNSGSVSFTGSWLDFGSNSKVITTANNGYAGGNINADIDMDYQQGIQQGMLSPIVSRNGSELLSGDTINLTAGQGGWVQADMVIFGLISAQNDININAPWGFVCINDAGSIISGETSYSQNGTLLINADGSIDPSSNMDATIGNNIINVNDFGDTSGFGGTININAVTLWGIGTLEAKGGSSDINITNNSTKSLTLNDLTANSVGQVIINGTPVTSYGDLTIITGGGTGLGDIDVNNNTASNINIAGNIEGNTVNIDNLGNTFFFGNIGNEITASNDINLSGNYLTMQCSELINSGNNINLNFKAIDSLSNVIITPNDINISTNSDMFFAITYMTAGNSINLSTKEKLYLDFDSRINANNNINLITDNFIILDDFSTITAGNNVVFSRATAGDIEISSTGMLSPQELGRVDGNIVIGNHADTNSLTKNISINSNIYSDSNSIEFNGTGAISVNRIISTRNLNDVWSEDHLTALSHGDSSDISFTGRWLNFSSNSKIITTANNNYAGGNINANIDIDYPEGVLTTIESENGSEILSGNSINFTVGQNAGWFPGDIIISGDMNINGLLKAEHNIKLNLPNGTLCVGNTGSIISGGGSSGQDAILLINANGSIDPSSNMTATINDSWINVDDFGGTSDLGASININGEVWGGTGTLEAKGCANNINITNNSTNNLSINGLTASSDGQVIINGTPVTSYGSLNIITGGSSELGDINVNNNTASTVFIQGNIESNNLNINANRIDIMMSTIDSNNDIYFNSNNYFMSFGAYINASNNLTISPANNGMEFTATELTADNEIKLTTNNFMYLDVNLNAGTNVNLIANDYIINTHNYSINAGGNVIFSRATAGDIEISATGMLTPQELGMVDGNIVIGNHADTNSLTGNIDVKSNVYTDGDSIEFNAFGAISVDPDIVVSTRDLNDVWSDDHLTALSQGPSGDISLETRTIRLKEGSILNGNNIAINSDDDFSGHGFNIYSENLLTLNILPSYQDVLFFEPNLIKANQLQSNIIEHNGPIDLTIPVEVFIGNLDNIFINNTPLNPTSIYIDTSSIATPGTGLFLSGNVSTPGNITLIANQVSCIENAFVNSGSTVTLKSNRTTISNSIINANNIIVENDKYDIDGITYITNSTLNARNDIVLLLESVDYHIYSGYIDSNLSANRNITIETINALNKPLYLNGTLTAGQGGASVNGTLLVNADGSIDPSSNMEATIASNTINVDDFGGTAGLGGTINITAENITGTGTLEAKGDSSDINITNNSTKSLTLNDLTANSVGQVIINGTPVTSYGDLTIITGGGTGLGDIDVNNNTASNINIAGNIEGNTVNIDTLGNIIRAGSLITADDLVIDANSILNYVPLNIANTTNITTTGDCLISGTTGALTANTGGDFFYKDIVSDSINVNAGGQINIDNGLISGNVNIITTAPGLDGPAEIMLGHLNDLDITGSLTATATSGNIYYYGGSVVGNATFNSGEAYNHRISTALGRYRPLDITGDLNVTSAGHMTFVDGSVGGDTVINAAKMAGLFDVDLGGDLTANALAFGYFKGTVGGNVDVTAPMGALFGVGGLLNVVGNVAVRSTNGPVDYYLGSVGGDLDITANTISEIGTVVNLSSKSFTYGGITYDINDVPYPIPVDDNNFTVGGDLTIDANDIIVDGVAVANDTNLTGDNVWTYVLSANNIDITAEYAGLCVTMDALEDINVNANAVNIQSYRFHSGNNINFDLENGSSIYFSDLYASNNININTGSTINFGATNTTAGNEINFTTNGKVSLDFGSYLNANTNINMIANDYFIDSSSSITAGGNVIFSRATAGDIEISDTGMLTPQELDRVDGNIVIGNHFDTNSLTNDIIIESDIYTDGDSIEFNTNRDLVIAGDVVVSTRDLNDVWSDDHMTALSEGDSGNIDFKSGFFQIGGSYILAGTNNNFTGGNITFENQVTDFWGGIIDTNNNISINPTMYLNLEYAQITAGNNLILNAGSQGIFHTFNPRYITANTLESDFLQPEMIINRYHDIGIGNLDNIIINGSKLNFTNISLTSSYGSAGLSGNITVNGDITLHSYNGNVSLGGGNVTINAQNDINLTAKYDIWVEGNIHADNISLEANNISIFNYIDNWGPPMEIHPTVINVNKSISLTASENIDLIEANITANTANNKTDALTINEDGTMVGSDRFVTSSIANTTYFDNLSAGIITMNAPNINGYAILKAIGDTSDVTITNNSANNLQFNDFKAATTGQIIINGSQITQSFDDVIVDITQASGVGNIDINNNTASNIYIAGNIEGNTVNIDTLGNIIRSGSLITANDLVIDANSILNYVPLNIANSTNITTTGDCLISGITGTLTANTGGLFTYNNVNANSIDLLAGGMVDISTANVSGDVNIATTDSINYAGDIGGNLTATGSSVDVTSQATINVNQVIADNSVVLNSTNGSILDARPDETANIITQNIGLYANNGSIGTLTNDLNIELTACNLDASANNDINLTINNGSADIGVIESYTGNVYLKALNGYIYDGNGDDANVIANNAVIEALYIGSNLDLNIANSTNITTTGDCLISGITGALTANTGGLFTYNNAIANSINLLAGGLVDISTANVSGDVNIATTDSINYAGDIGGTLTATGSSVDVTSQVTINVNQVIADNYVVLNSTNGSILDARPDETANIITQNIGLYANNGSIGTLTDDFNIELTACNLDASANNDINLTINNGSADIGVIESYTGNVYLKALNGSIFDGNGDDANIIANNAVIEALSIGISTDYLESMLAGSLDMHTAFNIYFEDLLGDLDGNTILSDNGSIYLNAPDGAANISHISALGDISVTARDGVNIDTIDPANINLQTTNGGINVNNGLASNTINLIGDIINVNFSDTDNTSPLSFNVSGATNKWANNVTVNGASNQGINFNSLYTINAIINNLNNNTELNIYNAEVTNNLAIKSDILNATINVDFNNVAASGTDGNAAQSISILNSKSNLNITNLDTNNAYLATNGEVLNINNAIINDTGILAVQNKTIIIHGDGSGRQNAFDVFIGSPKAYKEPTNISNSNASIDIGMDTGLIIIDAKNDFASDTNITANAAKKLEEEATKKDDDDNDSLLLQVQAQITELSNPLMYLLSEYQNYTASILQKANQVYLASKANKESDKEALAKAAQILKQANFNADVSKQLIQKNFVNSNNNYINILKTLISSLSLNISLEN